MATETITRLLDDFDPTQEASETVTIGYRGFLYSIDLTEEHAQELDGILEPYVQAAHEKAKWGKRIQTAEKTAAPVTRQRRKPASLTADERRAAREWGRENGFQVATRGILPPDLVKAYKKAQRTASKV